MNHILSFRKAVVTLVVIFLYHSAFSQNLVSSRQSSYRSYIYKLSDKEAREINKRDAHVIDSTYFHTLVDSYPTDSVYAKKLAPGHYLKTNSIKNKQQTFYTYVPDFDVKILNNNTDLYIQVFSLSGKIISDASVKIGLKTVRFDNKTQCYIDKKSNRKGLLKVDFNGNTAYFQLARKMNNSALLRNTRKIMYGTPLKYVWIPVSYVISLPIDGVKSIVRGRPQGAINRTKYIFVNLWNKITDPSDYNSYKQNYKGYMVFNKPKYLPGDTVKFKAFIVSKKGKPLNKKVFVSINNEKKDIRLTELAPFRKGGYEFQFFLHDSLNLKLDRHYNIELENKKRKNYFSSSFKYEDYELNNTKLNLRTETETHYKGKSFTLYAKGTDDNDLNLLDARLEITLKAAKVLDYFENLVFVPDTIWTRKMELKPTGETEIQVPDSVFPKANVNYTIEVRMLTSDNKTYKQSKNVSYYYNRSNFEMNLINDSLEFNYFKNGEATSKKIAIHSTDNFGNNSEKQFATTPCKFPLNVFYKSYTVLSDSLDQTFNIASEPSLLKCLSQRTKDSVMIEVDNPRKLHFTYNIYKRNTEKLRGSGDSLSYRKSIDTKQNYFISLRYLWAGSIKEETFRIPYADKKLNIAVKQPRMVYPGQNVNMEITVTDQRGKPVEGVDLTAYSMTKKFDYKAPTLPYLGKQMPNKELINNFSFKRNYFDSPSLFTLNYEAWKMLAEIDSIEYYKFLYPGNKIYRYEYSGSEGITQFAPFVVTKDGDMEQIHVIYVDNKPVYFSWSTNRQPYSFKIDSGFHQIRLRISDKEITLKKTYFPLGRKTILSLSKDLIDDNVTSSKFPTTLTYHEKSILNRYIFPYRNNFGENFAYLKDGKNLQLLSPSTNGYNRNFAGPVSGFVSTGILNGYSLEFQHEPNFEYEFSPGILKMREINDSNLPSYNYLSALGEEKNLSDSIFTQSIMDRELKTFLEMKRRQKAQYHNPYNTVKGFGKLKIEVQETGNKTNNTPLNLVFLRYDEDNFIRVYPGSEKVIHQLYPGLYKMISFFPGSYYHITDYIDIKADGTTYFRMKSPENLKKDSFSIKVNSIIESTIFASNTNSYVQSSDLNQIHNYYMQQYPYTGEGETISGKIYEQTSGEPIFGASITIKGTNYGTISDFNGNYTLKIPQGKHEIRVSYIGYVSKEINLLQAKTTSIGLMEDLKALDEVVVIGYGTQKKSLVVGAVSSISSTNSFGYMNSVSSNMSETLQGRVAGISVSPSSGASIMIRGSASIDFAQTPLFIIDGSVYTGDISKLDPSLLENIEILKDAEATAIYGARAANGVVLISTKGNVFKTTLSKQGKGADYDKSFLEAASQANSIRHNFSDYAFWQPRLTTNKDGKATFNTTFPDDVTSWQTFVLAMNDKKQSGQSGSNIKSYKPLMAQLAVPNFLLENDSAIVIGKALNYMPDSVDIKTSFEVNLKSVFTSSRFCVNSSIDSLQVIAPTDSISIRYTLTKADGYFDGEQRKIPIYPIGLEETKGSFYILDKDTTITPTFDSSLDAVTVYAHADYLDILNTEIGRLINYKYYCNEQIASKLKALLFERTIAQYKGKKAKNDTEIERLIGLLLKNKNQNGFWGWWKGSETHYEFSVHVLQALSQAKKDGFKVNIDETKLAQLFVAELESNIHSSISKDICTLKMLKTLNCVVDYKTYIEKLDKTKNKDLNNHLNLIELKQLCGLKYSTDTLKALQQKTMFGNIYYKDENAKTSLMSNNIQNTLIAYRILKNEKLTGDTILAKIRRYFLETKQNNCWWNTYESAQILETILPDILGPTDKWEKSVLKLSGDINKTVTEFPYELKLNQNQHVSITKTGNDPIYLTAYQHSWNKNPKTKSGDFVINTHFEDNKAFDLKAGKLTKLIVNIEVKNDADYVMLQIPIPAGCSYGEKTNYYRNEVHREYLKNETDIYCQKLQKGNYIFEINLMPRFNGKYTLNPAKAELMYFPTFNANNESKKVSIH